jgi:hypothetical protein
LGTLLSGRVLGIYPSFLLGTVDTPAMDTITPTLAKFCANFLRFVPLEEAHKYSKLQHLEFKVPMDLEATEESNAEWLRSALQFIAGGIIGNSTQKGLLDAVVIGPRVEAQASGGLLIEVWIPFGPPDSPSEESEVPMEL